MGRKSGDFSMEDAKRLAGSPAGQQLLAMLRGADPERLQQVVQQASSGNYQQAGQMLRQLLSSSEAQTLMRQLEEP